ncbi:spermidine/putrescine ABC transporter substrate-binding protein [Kaistia dalseonensis]|uniref:Spermidine/putrescine transport system substrate-binding protein n=1 Tax=Kaistia dalseonensis TaxID=410840 RepID=A0ABU0H9M1_9HYPH|nr:spermidine/putrescine ABC transporter substrate-binding protein [Kaistia dalseonensis]MCX5495587.1 spermidine/putrescine ABC transporter substrate-binding protein [Kaistia dalseonensis]MDQ0438179.1 spermidine/putrescine transport system substrate-binding protein [Kaistia dalseonensis]
MVDRSSPPKSLLSRRTMLGLLGAAPATAALSAAFPGSLRANAAGTGQLNIYSWPDYFSADNLATYAKKSGVTPNITTYDSNETLFAKLNSPAGAGFDIVIPSSSWIKQLADKGLLAELDHTRLNLASLDQDLLDRDYDRGNKYSIPKDWGLLGVVYDPEATGGEIKTWEDFFKAGERPEVSGKIRLSDSGWETIGTELWLQGKDWNTATVEEIKAAGERLKSFAKHVKSFSGLDPNAVANGSIVMAQTNQGTARAAIGLNPKLKWSVPGPFSELWVDNYAIPKNAPNVDQAYDFLSFMLQPDVQLAETKYVGFPAAVAGLREKIGADTPNADLIFGGKDLDFKKLTSFVVNPETIGTYLQVQTEIQAAAG